MEGISGNMERSIKHCMIAASAKNYIAMMNLIEGVGVSRDAIDSTLAAYEKESQRRLYPSYKNKQYLS